MHLLANVRRAVFAAYFHSNCFVSVELFHANNFTTATGVRLCTLFTS